MLSILKVRGANPEKHVVKAYNLRLSIAPLMHDIEFNVKHEFKVSQSDTLVRVWVPAEVVEYSLSRMVGTLSHGAMKQEKKAVSLYIPVFVSPDIESFYNYSNMTFRSLRPAAQMVIVSSIIYVLGSSYIMTFQNIN